MGLLDDCEKYFGTRNLYDMLQVNKDAPEKAIKFAYKKMSLKVHPDRAEDKETATIQFQVLSKVSHVLLDEDLRSLYDMDGEIDDTSASYDKNIKDWSQYWKTLFNITYEDLKKYDESYRKSALETEELKLNYLHCEGDMDKIFEQQLCSRIEDEPRFRKILQRAIKVGEIPDFDNFSKEPRAKRLKRQRFYESEAREAKEALGGVENENDLKKSILKRQDIRQKEMDLFIANLEAKYAKPSKSKATASNSNKRRRKM